MKRTVLILSIFSLVFLLSGCNSDNKVISMNSYELDEYEVNNYSDASMEIVVSSLSPSGLTVRLNYSGDNEGSTGDWYALFFYEDDHWSELPYIVDHDVYWYMIAYMVEKNHALELSINWSDLYGEMASGRYLVVKQFTDYREPGDYDDYYLACEFSLMVA